MGVREREGENEGEFERERGLQEGAGERVMVSAKELEKESE